MPARNAGPVALIALTPASSSGPAEREARVGPGFWRDHPPLPAGRSNRGVTASIAVAADLRVNRRERDRGRLNKTSKVLIVESWVHFELEIGPRVGAARTFHDR